MPLRLGQARSSCKQSHGVLASTLARSLLLLLLLLEVVAVVGVVRIVVVVVVAVGTEACRFVRSGSWTTAL